jgi:hypothetical protein
MLLTQDQPISGSDSAIQLVDGKTWEEQSQSKEDDQEGENDSGEEYEEYKEDPFYYDSSYNSKKLIQAKQKGVQPMGGDTAGDEERKDQPEEQGSSSEPEWGRRKSPDHENDLKTWQETNIGPNNKEAYRFGHCHLCNVPISTRHATFPFTCFECRKEEQNNINTEVSSSKDKGKNERDDEEEFYRIRLQEKEKATMKNPSLTCWVTYQIQTVNG